LSQDGFGFQRDYDFKSQDNYNPSDSLFTQQFGASQGQGFSQDQGPYR
jgi:hypothetical protein